MLANYHTHTVRCNHAHGTEREYVEAAIKAGFKTLGFSDHVPQPYPDSFTSGIRMAMSDIEDYTSVLTTLKEEYKHDIEILIGYETEYTTKYFRTLVKELCNYPIDYMILGQHYVPDEIEGSYMGMPVVSEKILKQYADLVIEGLHTGLFTYLAHPDLIHFIGHEDSYDKQMSRITDTAIELDIPLEVNVYGFVDGRHYPCDRYFKAASAKGARFVLGCDAHEPDMLFDPMQRPDFAEFISRNDIVIESDNIIMIGNDFKAKAASYLSR